MPARLLGERGTVSPASNCTITAPEAHAGEVGQHGLFHPCRDRSPVRHDRVIPGTDPRLTWPASRASALLLRLATCECSVQIIPGLARRKPAPGEERRLRGYPGKCAYAALPESCRAARE